MSTYVADQKLVGEDITLVVDFNSRLVIGEVALTCSANITLYSGTSHDMTSMLVGAATISNNIVSQVISGGLAGNIYTVWVSVRTTETNVLVNEVRLAVMPDSSIDPPPAP